MLHERQMHSSRSHLTHSSGQEKVSQPFLMQTYFCTVSAGIARMRSEKWRCYRSCWLRKGQNAIFHSDSYRFEVVPQLLFICVSLGLILKGHETLQHILWEVKWTVHPKKWNFWYYLSTFLSKDMIFSHALSTKGVILHCAGHSFPCN